MKPKIRYFKKGEFLLTQNESSRHMFVVKKGKISIYRKEGDMITYSAELGEGSTVGELSLIDSLPRSATAIALEDVEVSVVYPEDVDEANKLCPPWMQALARSLAFRTRTVLASLERNSSRYSERSIVALLIYFSIAEDEKKNFNQSKLVEKIATTLRMSSFDVGTKFDELQEKKLVTLKNTELYINDLEELEKYYHSINSGLEKNELDAQRP